ncbi:MAG: hypothetical protein ACO1OX_07720 [Novosphingobium sp.]
MILTDISEDELRWLDDLSALDPEVRMAVLILTDALCRPQGASLHSVQNPFRHDVLKYQREGNK